MREKLLLDDKIWIYFAPAAFKTAITSSWPSLIAYSRAVPHWVLTLMSALASIKNLTTSAWPCQLAMNVGVCPAFVATLTSAPAPTNTSSTSRWRSWCTWRHYPLILPGLQNESPKIHGSV